MPSPPIIRFRADEFAAWAAARRLSTDAEQAEYIGVNPSTLRRVRSGDIVPGEHFIASLLASSGRKFEKFFEIATAA